MTLLTSSISGNGSWAKPESTLLQKPIIVKKTFKTSIFKRYLVPSAISDDTNKYFTDTEMKEQKRNLFKLDEISRYTFGNDQSIHVSDTLIKFVKKVIINLGNKQPELFPTGGGQIQIEYEKEGNYLEFLFLNQQYMDYYSCTANGEDEQEGIPFDMDFIKKKVAEFYE